jgi:hypothetical protein
LIGAEITRMRLDRNWLPIGATKFRAQQGGDGSAEGDSSGGPLPERRDRGSWPTLVIEAGYTQSVESLRSRMHWWFETSDHEVKIVLLAKFAEGGGRRIILEKWIETPTAAAQCEGMVTRSAPQLEQTRHQLITISRNHGTPISYTVISDVPLRLEFHLLFLRQPDPQEGDVVIDAAGLEFYASCVWDRL